MPVAVKLDAFEFTKYGSLDGNVQWVGADAVKHEQLGQVFPVRIVLKKTQLPVAVDGSHPEIRIGMSVTADMAIGKRKAYEFFLGPLLKYKNESLRER
jgi:hemolysin D